MRYKIGDKVCIVEWEGVVESTQGMYNIAPSYWVGRYAIISDVYIKQHNNQMYFVDFMDGSFPSRGVLFFEKELEPITKAGEQLMLFKL